MFQFCPLYFFYFPLPFQSCDLMSHGPSPDLSHDFHHMTILYCSYLLLSCSLLSTLLGDIIVLPTIILPSPLSPLIVLLPIVLQDPLFISLGRLVMVAASVVYKLYLYHRRGLKPDLVYLSKYCCFHQPLYMPTSCLFGSSQGPLRLSLQTSSSLQDIHLGKPLQGTTIIIKGASPL